MHTCTICLGTYHYELCDDCGCIHWPPPCCKGCDCRSWEEIHSEAPHASEERSGTWRYKPRGEGGVMPQYQCQQPDGKWAIFSTVVDDFTWVNLDEEDCRGVMLHQYNYSPETVERGFRIARREEEATTPFLEYHWWEECIGAIASVHGRKALRETLSEIGLGEKKEG